MPRRLVPALLLGLAPLLSACGNAEPPGETGADTGGEAAADRPPAAPRVAPDVNGRAAFLTLLGDDTLAMEWMEFQGRRVDVEAIIRGPRTMFGDYHLELGPQGEVLAYTAVTHAGTSSSGEILSSADLVEGEEGPELLVIQGGEERRIDFPAEPGAVPFVDMLHWPFEASLRWQMDAAGRLGDHVPAFTSRGVMAFELVENADGTWQLVHPSRGPSTMRIDGEGRILALDGTGSTRAYDLRRLSWDQMDQEAMTRAFTNRPMGELSGRGRIDDTVDGVHFTGHYGEPLKRGRTIFGELLAYGEWWRTGANQATHLSFDGDIVVDGERIPAGDYTLSSIPEEDGGTLIINRRTGQGGQSYDESLDQARVRMRRGALDATVEALEIRAVPTEDGGRLELRWDRTVYWVPFQAA